MNITYKLIKKLNEKKTNLKELSTSIDKNIKYLSVILDRLVKRGLVEVDKQQPYQYFLSPEGRNYLQDLEAEEQRKREKEDRQRYEEAFEEYTLNILKEFFYLYPEPTSTLTFDFSEFFDFLQGQKSYFFPSPLTNGVKEIAPVEVLDFILDKGEDGLNYIQAASDFVFGRSIPILLTNLDKVCKDCVKSVNKIRASDIGKLRVIIGEVSSRSDTKLFAPVVKYECPSCGIIPFAHKIGEKKLKKCPRCGSRMRIVQENQEDLIRIVIRDMYSVIDTDEQPEEISILMIGNHYPYHKIIEGEGIKITGIPQIYVEDKKEVVMRKEVYAYNIEKLDEKYKKVNIVDEDKAKISEIAKDPIAWFKAHIFSDLEDVDVAIEAAILSLFERIHLLFLGDSGTGKTEILKRISEIAIKSKFVSTPASTAAGLIGTVSKNQYTEKFGLTTSVIRELNPEGLLVLDEISKASLQIQFVLLDVMQNGRMSINKAGVNTTYPAKINILATANLENEFENKIFSKFGLTQPMWDRFDLKVFFRRRSIQDYEKWLRLYDTAINNTIDDYTLSLIKKYLLYSRGFAPKMDKQDIQNMASLAHEYVIHNDNYSYRIKDKIKKLYSAYHKMYLLKSPKPFIGERIRAFLDNLSRLEILYKTNSEGVNVENVQV